MPADLLDPTPTDPDRRLSAPPSRMARMVGALAIVAALCMLLPGLLWSGGLIYGWLADRIGGGMLLSLPVALLMVLLSLVLLQFGWGRMRSTVPSLDRRNPA